MWLYCSTPRASHSRAAPAYVGKWMAFVSPSVHDARWRAVCDALASGDLGCGAKTPPTGPDASPPSRGFVRPSSPVIIVYVPDFRDRADVARVAASLRKITGSSVNLSFKADCQTYEGEARHHNLRSSDVPIRTRQNVATCSSLISY